MSTAIVVIIVCAVILVDIVLLAPFGWCLWTAVRKQISIGGRVWRSIVFLVGTLVLGIGVPIFAHQWPIDTGDDFLSFTITCLIVAAAEIVSYFLVRGLHEVHKYLKIRSTARVRRPQRKRRWFFWVGIALLTVAGLFWLILIPFIISRPNTTVIVGFFIISSFFIAPGLYLLIRGRGALIHEKSGPPQESVEVASMSRPIVEAKTTSNIGHGLSIDQSALTMDNTMANKRKKQSTKKLMIAAILDFVAGASFVATACLSAGSVSFGDTTTSYPFATFAVIWGIAALFAVVGGICALQKKCWPLALTGTIFAIFGYGLGIPALVLLQSSRSEFLRKTAGSKHELTKNKRRDKTDQFSIEQGSRALSELASKAESLSIPLIISAFRASRIFGITVDRGLIVIDSNGITYVSLAQSQASKIIQIMGMCAVTVAFVVSLIIGIPGWVWLLLLVFTWLCPWISGLAMRKRALVQEKNVKIKGLNSIEPIDKELHVGWDEVASISVIYWPLMFSTTVRLKLVKGNTLAFPLVGKDKVLNIADKAEANEVVRRAINHYAPGKLKR